MKHNGNRCGLTVASRRRVPLRHPRQGRVPGSELGKLLGPDVGAPPGTELGEEPGSALGALHLLGNALGNGLGKLGAALVILFGDVLGCSDGEAFGVKPSLELGTGLGDVLGTQLGDELGGVHGSKLGKLLGIDGEVLVLKRHKRSHALQAVSA